MSCVDSQLLVKHMEAYEGKGFDAIQGRILPGVVPTGIMLTDRRLREYNIPYIDYGENIHEIRGFNRAQYVLYSAGLR